MHISWAGEKISPKERVPAHGHHFEYLESVESGIAVNKIWLSKASEDSVMLVYVSLFSLIIAPEYRQTVEPLPKSYWYKPGCSLSQKNILLSRYISLRVPWYHWQSDCCCPSVENRTISCTCCLKALTISSLERSSVIVIGFKMFFITILSW